MAEKREFVLGMLIGSAIGAAVALLYAPQGGDDTRDLLRQKSTEAKEKVTGVAETVKHTVSEKAGTVKTTASGLVEKSRGFVDAKKAQVTAAVDAGRQAYQQKKSELETDVQEDTQSGLGTTPRDNGAGAEA